MGILSRKNKGAASRTRSKGFTLVETAIVVTIGAILLSGALSGYKTYLNKQRYETTKERLSKIAKALDDYRRLPSNTNKNLPCPAPLHAAPGTAGYGHDVATTLGVACNSAGGAMLGDTFSRASGDPLLPVQYVRIGAVPFATLGISAEDAQDAWGRRFIYAVSEKHTDTSAPYDPDQGSITVYGDTTTIPIGGNKVPFFVYTSGKSGAGGITADGTDYYVPCSASSTLEQNNCAWRSGSGTARIEFRAATYSESGATATNFDDIPVYNYEDNDIVSNTDDLDDCKSNMTSFIFLGGDNPAPLSTGANNTGMGVLALLANTTGANNTAIGYRALVSNTTGVQNVAVGVSALMRNVGNNYNTALGYGALAAISGGSASNNVAVGHRALATNTTSGNVAVGVSALLQNAGPNNTAVGYLSMGGINSGTNTAVGYQSLRNNQSGTGNTAIGENAMLDNLRANNNTAVGSNALMSAYDVIASNNTAIGRNSLQNTVNGASNTAVGSNAMNANTDGSGNVAVGALALQANNADYNTAMGYRALEANTSSYNTAVGTYALALNTTGQFNTALGYGALGANTAGYSASPFHWANTAVGGNALAANTTGYNNVAVGNYALGFNTTTNNNTAIGAGALYNNVASDNTAVGANALNSATINSFGFGDNTAVGSHALYSLTTGDANVAVGKYALYNNTTSVGNTAVGTNALVSGTGKDNVAIGRLALSGSTGGEGNVGIGNNALEFNRNGFGNIGVGLKAGNTAVDTSFNTAIGTFASAGNQSFNSMLGAKSAPYDTGTYLAVAIGLAAQADTNGVAVGAPRLASTGPGTPYPTLLITDGTVARRNAVAIGSNSIAEDRAIAIGFAARAITGHAVMALGPNPPDLRLDCYLGGCSLPSDMRMKKDIKDIDLGLPFIESLHPVSFYWKEGGDDNINYGFLAQEVEKALGSKKTNVISRQKNKEKTYVMDKEALIAPIVKAIQEIAAKLNPVIKAVEELAARLNPLEKTVVTQQSEINDLKKIVKEQQEKIDFLMKAIDKTKPFKSTPD